MKINIKQVKNIMLYMLTQIGNKESGGGNRGTAGLPYPSMTTDEICELPIKSICDDTSILFFWATLEKLRMFEVINAGFGGYYGLGFDWGKDNKNRLVGNGILQGQNTKFA